MRHILRGQSFNAPCREPDAQHRELPIAELLGRARPLPPHEEMVIEDLSEAEGADFLAAVDS